VGCARNQVLLGQEVLAPLRDLFRRLVVHVNSEKLPLFPAALVQREIEPPRDPIR
jgi:hypothetical protein